MAYKFLINYHGDSELDAEEVKERISEIVEDTHAFAAYDGNLVVLQDMGAAFLLKMRIANNIEQLTTV